MKIGSSPRVRGTSAREYSLEEVQRFIPTSAGNIYKRQFGYESCSVHPHECGEHTGNVLLVVKKPGSSPRVRGT